MTTPGPSDFESPLLTIHDDDTKKFTVAALWLKDAMGFRTVNMKTLDSPSPLFFYIERHAALKFLYSPSFQFILLMAVCLHLVVPLGPHVLFPFKLLSVITVYTIREALLLYVRPFRARIVARFLAILTMGFLLIQAQLSMVTAHDAAMVCGVFAPLFLIDIFPSLRFMATAMITASISVFPIVISIACLVILFGCLGHLFFSGHFLTLVPNNNFRDVTTSIFSMLYLMTTVNFPDIMMPNYHQNRIVFVFFGIYLVLTLLMFAWLLTSVYGAYVDIRLKQLTVMVTNQKASLVRVFERTADNGEALSRDNFRHLMLCYRPDLKEEYAQALYTLMDHDEVGYISKRCWLDHANRCLDIMIQQQKQSDTRFRHPIQILATSVPILLIRTFVIAIDTWLLLERILIPLSEAHLKAVDISICFLQGVFFCEAILKIILLRGSILQNRFQKIDIIVILVSSIGILEFKYREYFQMIAIGRIFSLMPLFQKTHSLRRICLLLSGMFALTLSVFYVFAYIGTLLFADKIADTPELRARLLNVDKDVANIWIGAHYFDLNFNTFADGLVLLFVLAIVNNWHVITNGYIILTGSIKTSIFFISFYFVAVVLVLNIATGLILEEFMLTRIPRSQWQARLRQILTKQFAEVPVTEWVVRKPVHLQLMLMDHIDSEFLNLSHFKTLFQTTHLMPV